MKTDVLIIGSGAAGLNTAIELSKRDASINILIVTKSTIDESSTKYAQGGIAAVLDDNQDSINQHINDTLEAGKHHNNREVVEYVIRSAGESLKELISNGAQFDKNQFGNFDFNREGGHRQKIILHHKDSTGKEVERTLVEELKQYNNIKVLEHCLILELNKKENQCIGAVVCDVNNLETFSISSKFTVLATGGLGQIFSKTTNPLVSNGDGIAMAYRLGAHLSDMEFLQFHPTALYQKDRNPLFLISEAVRGKGAFLLNHAMERFMKHYDPMLELATRDVVSRAIVQELQRSKTEFVYLDVRHISDFDKMFPSIFQECIKFNINPLEELIPVTPAMHYVCGGINVNLKGQSSINRLYACGENSFTGLHGANRLASNSLLEALVYSKMIAEDIIKQNDSKFLFENFKKNISISNKDKMIEKQIDTTKKELWVNLGMVRNNESLENFKSKLTHELKILNDKYLNLPKPLNYFELENIYQLGLIITDASIKREGNIGCFFKEKEIKL